MGIHIHTNTVIEEQIEQFNFFISVYSRVI